MKKIIKSRAAILFKQNSDLIIDDIELPKKLSYGQVLVKMKYSSICGSQIGEIKGVKGKDHYLPHLLGHEGSGIVIEKDISVKKVEIGDKVVLHWKKGEGIQSENPTYNLGNKKINAGSVTTFNEFAVISENRITKLPKNMPLDIAPLFGCAITTAFGTIENLTIPKFGNKIVVIGGGGVGLNILQGLKFFGTSTIIVVDINNENLKLSKKIGADFSINISKKKTWHKEVIKLLNGSKPNIIFENTGNIKNIENSIKLASDEGQIVLLGVPKFNSKVSFNTLPLHFGKTIIGSHGGNGNPTKDITRYYDFIKKNKINLKRLISKIIKLDDINLEINKIISGKSHGRIMIKF